MNRSKPKKVIHFTEGWGETKPRIQNFLDRIEELDPDKPNMKSPKVPKEEYSNIYHVIFEMCNQKDPYNLSEQLYKAFEDTMREYFQNRCIPDLRKASGTGGKTMLKTWAWRWWVATKVIEQMQRNFRFLDRYYVPSQDTLKPLLLTGYYLYNETVYNSFKDKLPEVIFDMIQREREGEDMDRVLMRDTIDSFVVMGKKLAHKEASEDQKLEIYRDLFERQFIERTKIWYKQKTQQWKNESTPEYLRVAERQIQLEDDRLISYVNTSTKEEFESMLQTVLLMDHQIELLDKATGIGKMFDRTGGLDVSSAREDLSRLYVLYSMRGELGLRPIAERLKDHIAKEGDKFVTNAKQNEGGKNSEKEQKLVVDLLKLHTQFNAIVTKQFKGHHLMVKALRDGFKQFINREEYVAVRLAAYSHQCLKKGGQAGRNIDMTDRMENIVKLYEYINDKDFFELNYQRFLADRLINNSSESYDNEKVMIAKLKMVGGNATWSKKLEEMFKDLQSSENLMNEFQKSSAGFDNTVDFQCKVCTYGQWPSSQFDVIEMPKDVKKITDKFAEFYAGKFSGRMLEYRMDQGRSEVMVPLLDKSGKKVTKKYTFVVSPFQMKVLLAFNKKNEWEHTELQAHTDIKNTDENFDRALLSLAHPKMKVLKKRPNSKECKEGDRYRVNNGFKHNRLRVVVPPYQGSLKRKNQQNLEEKRHIQKLREHQCDAAIVRIMKSRKELEHTLLQQETVRQLTNHFIAKPQFIKKRIAILIDQEYIKRHPKERTKYQYIA